MLAMIAGTSLAAVLPVLPGHKSWADGGCDAAEFVLQALEIEPEEARRITNWELPPLSK